MTNEAEIKKWLKRAEKLIDDIPEETEVHISYTYLSLYPKGRMNEHLESSEDGFGINDNSELGSIGTNSRFIPYSEGT